jgi:hypothetical protein
VPARSRSVSRLRRLLTVGGTILALFILWEVLTYYIAYTDDAYVRSDLIGVAPEVTGPIISLSVIDNQAIELTMLQAATHLDEGEDDAVEIATAKYWAAEGGNRIGHAALHIHGGISIDLDYAIHRYFLWLKAYEFALGSATPSLLRIGKALADEPVAN